MNKKIITNILLILVISLFQGCVDPYDRSPVDQIVEFPSDIWKNVSRTHAP